MISKIFDRGSCNGNSSNEKHERGHTSPWALFGTNPDATNENSGAFACIRLMCFFYKPETPVGSLRPGKDSQSDLIIETKKRNEICKGDSEKNMKNERKQKQRQVSSRETKERKNSAKESENERKRGKYEKPLSPTNAPEVTRSVRFPKRSDSL